MRKTSVFVSFTGLLTLVACGPTPTTGQGGAGGTGGAAPFALTSPAFDEGKPIPAKYQCTLITGGTNWSPPLNWTAGPAGTASYAVVLRDIDLNFNHWAIWDIPVSNLALPEHVEGAFQPAIPMGAKQASLSAAITGYFGPCSADAVDTYEFTVYAIPSATLSGLTQTSTAAQAIQAIVDAAVAHASLSGES